MVKPINTNYEYTFEDGTKANLTLTFYALYQLKGKNKSLYERYNKIATKGMTDELESIVILYTAYSCANLLEDELMSEEEFMIKCGSDRKAVGEAVQALMNPKKQ